MVFCGLFPVDSSEYQKLKDGLAKLQLNDASFSFEPESSSALGLGFRFDGYRAWKRYYNQSSDSKA